MKKGMTPPEIVYTGELPPIFDKILAVFPMASKPGVVFAYGQKIFVPSGRELPREIYAHELVHCRRQLEFGLDAWWDLYLKDECFRYNEELLAHRAEYQELCNQSASRQVRRQMLTHVAKKLSAALYGRMTTFERAKRDLLAKEEVAIL